LFLDTRAAVSGESMKTYDAAALIADQSEALVTPVRLAGAERTMASRVNAAYVGRRLFPKVTVTILPPRRLAASASC
jgi:acyl-[acyl-carrier-protein]-phospholipid O-acyltransferase/long-chain-fatty-acid--[acyl-carrier-protein] ligase